MHTIARLISLNTSNISPLYTHTHTLRFRGLHVAPRSQFNVNLHQLVIEETQLPLHLVTATHLIDELALEGIHVSIHLCVWACVCVCVCCYMHNNGLV